MDFCHKEAESHAELKLTSRKFHIHAHVQENRRPSCQHGTATDTASEGCAVHHNKALKGAKRGSLALRVVVGAPQGCRSGKRRFSQNRGDDVVGNRRVVERYVLISCSAHKKTKQNKKNLFVDTFHFLLGPLPWQRSETGAPNVSVRVKGSYELWINLRRGSYFD